MAGLVFDRGASPYGDTHASLICAGVHLDIHDVSSRAKQGFESVLYSESGAFRFNIDNEGTTQIHKIHPFTEIIALCAMAFPYTNEWVQKRICRSLIGKNIIKPTDEYVDNHSDYMKTYYPERFRTRNIGILAPSYALHIAGKRSMEILLTTKVTDIQKVICSLPFSVASRQKFPMDVVLLDQQYRKFNCETFAIGIMKRIDQDALTSDQKNLLKRSVQILLGNAEM